MYTTILHTKSKSPVPPCDLEQTHLPFLIFVELQPDMNAIFVNNLEAEEDQKNICYMSGCNHDYFAAAGGV